MFMEERLNEIEKIIKEKGKISTAYIQQEFGVSFETARRDLRILEERGVCIRTHGGGIMPTKQVGFRPPADRDFASMPVYENYREIAKRAAALIEKNDTVYMAGGSLGYIMLTYLPKDIHYTLVVNCVDIAKELRAFENADVYLVGGKMRQSGSVVDSMARDFVSRLHFDKCFMTGAGFTTEFGLSNGTDETASFQRTVIGNSRKKYLLIPSSKIGADAFVRVCGAEEFDAVITDWDCAEEAATAIAERGIEVNIVEKCGE
ncbi:MAG: DeoR/GlpR transcriptional regulator [Clostridia bacterium]|nr:DeoR/GlpR transcriptional regulator [Clostridia bacterium]